MSVAIGGGVGDHIALIVQQLHAHALQSALARILDPVTIAIDPYGVSQACNRIDPRIDRIVVVSGVQGYRIALAGAGIGITVFGIVTTLILRTQLVAVGSDELHRIGTGHQIGELIVSVAIGGGVGDHIALIVQQLHAHALQSALARILDPVTIAIDPNGIAKGSRGNETEINHRIDVVVTQVARILPFIFARRLGSRSEGKRK